MRHQLWPYSNDNHRIGFLLYASAEPLYFNDQIHERLLTLEKRRKTEAKKGSYTRKAPRWHWTCCFETLRLQNFWQEHFFFFFTVKNLFRGTKDVSSSSTPPIPLPVIFYSMFLRQDKSVTTFQTKRPASTTRHCRQSTPYITYFKNKGARHWVRAVKWTKGNVSCNIFFKTKAVARATSLKEAARGPERYRLHPIAKDT